jgi:hypothetical protein
MNKVVSFSLWGTDPKYLVGAIRNVELIRKIYGDDWSIWFYVDNDTVPSETQQQLEKFPGVQLRRYSAAVEPHWAMFWRFYACEDDTVDIAVFRDADSRPSSREFISVSQWLMSGKDYHIMRDHPQHGTSICGGMWGVRAGCLRNIRSLIQNYYDQGKTRTSLFGIDQDFLTDKVWPMASESCYINDPYFRKNPFSLPRDPVHFVGQSYTEKEIPIHV